MDTKSKVVVGIFIACVLCLFAYTYYKIVVEKDYVVRTYTSCDETANSCFKYVCSEEEGDECEEEIYAKIRKNINGLYLCNQYEEECEDLVCEAGELDCEMEYCTEENAEEGEVCIGPVEEGPLEQVEEEPSEAISEDVASTSSQVIEEQ